MKSKSFKEIMNDMVGDVLINTDIKDLNAGSAVDALAKALEAGMYAPCPTHEVGVRKLLEKFKIKSAWDGTAGWGGPLKVEGLDAILKNVTFSDDKLKLWKDIK
jgi:hypothetical protein